MSGQLDPELEATHYGLQMILAAGEADKETYNRVSREAGLRGPKFSADTIYAIALTCAKTLKDAQPDTWNNYLRFNMLNLEMKAQATDPKDTK